MDEALATRVFDYLQGRQSAMTALLQRLVTAESPSSDPESQGAVFEMLRAAFADRGYDARTIRGEASGGILYARPGSRDRGSRFQMLLGHADTVWPTGTLETMPLVVEGNHLRGPGAYDMKGGLVQGLFAIEALSEVGAAPTVTPVFLVNSDEEIGSHDSTPWIKRLARFADRVFVLEPSLGLDGHLKTSRKAIGRFTITVHGKAAHAGLDPAKGASAILELSHVIQSLFELNDPEHGISVNVGTIDGGLRPNVIAPVSKAVVDVRVPNQTDVARIEEAILGLEAVTPGTTLEIEGGIGRPAMEATPGNQRLWLMARDAAQALEIPIGESAVGGGSDANTTSQFAPTLDGLGPVGDGAHAVTEYLCLDRMVERAALLALLLRREAMQPQPGGSTS